MYNLFFLFDFNITKCTSFAVFLKEDYCCFRPKMTFIGNQFLKKLIHLRFWSDGADFKTEAQKFFNARTMHTT